MKRKNRDSGPALERLAAELDECRRELQAEKSSQGYDVSGFAIGFVLSLLLALRFLSAM